MLFNFQKLNYFKNVCSRIYRLKIIIIETTMENKTIEQLEKLYDEMKPQLKEEFEDMLIGFDEHGNEKKLFIDYNTDGRYDTMTQEEMDAELFTGTEYQGMKFKRLGEWDILSYRDGYSSPDFEFENGDVVAFDRCGFLCKIN